MGLARLYGVGRLITAGFADRAGILKGGRGYGAQLPAPARGLARTPRPEHILAAISFSLRAS